jgi:hypothetical protein
MSMVPMSMVLGKPVMTMVTLERERVLQERLNAVYDDLFALLKQQYRIADEEWVFSFLRQHSQIFPILQEGRAVVSLLFGEET